MSGGIYTTDKSKTLASLADVDMDSIQNKQAPVYDSTQEIFTNQTILTPSDLPSGTNGEVIVSDGAGGLLARDKLKVDINGAITGQFVNINSTNTKLGTSAGSSAGADNISIGWNSGLGAGDFAVAIGTTAGQSGGDNSVSIGFNAQANDNKCIVINSTGTSTQSQQAESCYINPLRNLNATTLPSPFVVQYDDSNKEIIKSEDLHTRDIICRNISNLGTLTNVSTASLYNGQLTVGTTSNRAIIGDPNAILSVDLQNRRVGINVLNPEEDLEVDGSIQIDSANVARLKFQQSGPTPHALGEIDGEQDGTNGGDLQFYTKLDGGSVTEKLRINNVGAIGIGGANYGLAGQVIVSSGSGSSVTWANQTDTTYSAGTGMSIAGTTFSIGQSVGVSDNPSFTQMSLGNTGTNQGILNLQDFTGVGNENVAQIKGIKEGTNGGLLSFHTKVDGGSLTERLRINDDGAIGIGGANYGLAGQVLTSNGTGTPSWQTPTTTNQFIYYTLRPTHQALTNITWQTVVYNSTPLHNTTTGISMSSGVITFGTGAGGLYKVETKAQVYNSSGQLWRLSSRLRLNNTTTISTGGYQVGSSTDPEFNSVNVHDFLVYDFADNDTLHLELFPYTDSVLTLQANANANQNVIMITKL